MLTSKIVDTYETKTVGVWDREHLEAEAKFTATMIERWGMVAGMPDGEDSSGKSKFRCATPQELVDMAVETSKILFARIREEGWTHIAPELPDGKDKE